MSESIKPTFASEVMLAGWKETHTGGAVVSFFLPNPADLDVFRGLTVHKGGKGGNAGVAGHRFMAVLVEIGDDEKPLNGAGGLVGSGSRIFEEARDEAINKHIIKPSVDEKPFGKEASQLYRNGFFYVPAVLEAIGTDAEFLDWIRTQPCAITGMRDYHKDEATGIVTERCDPAHVRRIANGAGVAEKPPYSAIPLLHALHDEQTKHGEAALYKSSMLGVAAFNESDAKAFVKEWMDKKRNEYVVKWASATLAKHFRMPSMGFVTPTNLFVWAKAHNVEHYLPEAYRHDIRNQYQRS